ncbi:hypothetical protein Bca4012_048239 [Brassica carinata]
MDGQDMVLLVHETWIRDADRRWIFEPDIGWTREEYIRLHTQMKLVELLKTIKERLHITSSEVTIKLSYQYPEWLSEDDEELDMPQHITDDGEVLVFIEMRRSIEEVPLYVTIGRHTLGVTQIEEAKEG